MRDLLAIYFIIGSGVWLVMMKLDIVTSVYQARVTAHGKFLTNRALIIATVLMITFWPLFVLFFIRGMWSAAR